MVSCFPFGLLSFLTLSTLWEEMGIVEKKKEAWLFLTLILKFFLPTAKITARLPGEIGAHIPAAEGLKRDVAVEQPWQYMVADFQRILSLTVTS